MELEDKTPVSPEEKNPSLEDTKKDSVVKTNTELGDKMKNLGIDIKNRKIKLETAEIVALSQLLDNIINKAQKGSLGFAIKNTNKVFMSNTKSVKP